MTPRSPSISSTLFRLAALAWEYRPLTIMAVLLTWAAFMAWS